MALMFKTFGNITPAVTTARQTFALNLRNGAVTEYEGFRFNSIALHNGKYYAAGVDSTGAEGIFELGGETDNGAPIEAEALTGAGDLEAAVMKRLPKVTFNMRGAGPVCAITVQDERTRREIPVSTSPDEGFRRREVTLHRRAKAAKWQVGFKNVDGGSFEIDAPVMVVEDTGRLK